jgi:hypothetical protein
MKFEIVYNTDATAKFYQTGRYWYFVVEVKGVPAFTSILYQSPGKAVNIFYSKYITKHLLT